MIDGKAAYSGALEPIDKNDTGKHGFIKGEITDAGCRIRFVPASVRRYIHEKITVTPQFTDQELQERIEACIREQGEQHFYKFILTGFRDPDIMFETIRRFSPGDSLYGHPAFGNEQGWNILDNIKKIFWGHLSKNYQNIHRKAYSIVRFVREYRR